MPRAARDVLLRAARAAIGGSPPPGETVDPSTDLALVLHLAAAHGLRRAVLDRLLADGSAADRAGGAAGITLDDLESRRLWVVAHNLTVIHDVRRAIDLLARHDIDAAMAAAPGVALLSSGRSAYELRHAAVVVRPDSFAAARAILVEHALDGHVQLESIPFVHAMTIPAPGGRLPVLTYADQRASLDADGIARRRLDVLVALAVLDDRPLDERAAAEALETTSFETEDAFARHGARHARHEIWIAGWPPFGGAANELDHLLDLLQDHRVDLHFVSLTDRDASRCGQLRARGIAIHDYQPAVLAGKTIVSFCSPEFLGKLSEMGQAGTPSAVIWFNCVTTLLGLERLAASRGWIDRWGFQSQFQRNTLMPELEELGPIRSFPYRPYFNANRVPRQYRDWGDEYRIGRISRDEPSKFGTDTWSIFQRVATPPHLKKTVYVLGYGPRAEHKIGAPPTDLDCTLWREDEVSATEFFQTIDTLILRSGGYRESSSRIVYEAYAYGVVPIVERACAFPELVRHGDTGFLAETPDQMIEFASMLAHQPETHRQIAAKGRRFLEESLAHPDACWSPWKNLLDLGD